MGTNETLIRAALLMREYDKGNPFYEYLSRWLMNQSDVYTRSFLATQSPSQGVDQPPGVHYGDPVSADRSATWHVRDALDIARAYLEMKGESL